MKLMTIASGSSGNSCFVGNDDTTILEQEPMRALAASGELKSFYHDGFWQCMDTKREKDRLELLWASGEAPWKTWND